MKTKDKSKNGVRLTESKLKQIVAEGGKKVLIEEIEKEQKPYEVYVCEWSDGDVTPNIYCDNDTMAETLDDLESDAWSYCEFADTPTVAMLFDRTSGETVKYYCSRHFTMAKYN